MAYARTPIGIGMFGARTSRTLFWLAMDATKAAAGQR
jgi:hypothetical protein